MASSSSHPNPNAYYHALQLKLKSDNYLLWRNQLLPILTFQKLIPHIDGTGVAPPPTVTVDGKTAPNPAYTTWNEDDNQTVIILHSSLTEESAAVIVGLTTAREIWVALDAAYNNTSVERVQLLRDSLRTVVRGSKSVADYGREFKAVCDQLSAIGHPIETDEQNHLFATGLGSDFLPFSLTAKALSPNASLAEMIAKAQSFELLSRSISNQTPTPAVAFPAQAATFAPPSRNPTNITLSGNNNRNPRNQGNSRFRGNRTVDPCQWCGIRGHKANVCRKLLKLMDSSSAGHSDMSSSSANATVVDEELLAKAFTAKCGFNPADADWYVDSGASDHMTGMKTNMTNLKLKTGHNRVTFGNGESLPVTHKGNLTLTNNLHLNDVLVVPNINKNLLSVSMLTKSNNVDVLFSYPMFHIQDRMTKEIVAQGRCEDGLYVLQNPNKALVASVSCPKASFEEWHARLGHVSLDCIKLLEKLGVISLSSILPKPGICAPCQMAKAHKLPFNKDEKRALHPLDLVHCDLWGPSPVTGVHGFRYYAAFVDDASRFCWIYPLKTKSDFFLALQIFLNFVQTQFSTKLKVFQSDGGTEFTNKKVQQLFETNGTLHRISCPYTPQQNGRVERKHRHIVETGLTMLFHSKLNPNLWVEAFSTAVFVINQLPSRVLDGLSPFEILYKTKPDFNSFKPFECRVYPLLRPYSEHKLSPRSLPCIFVGYSSKHKGYKCLDPTSSKTFITRHARFDKQLFPNASPHTESSPSILSITSFLDTTNLSPRFCPTQPTTSPSCGPPNPNSTPITSQPNAPSEPIQPTNNPLPPCPLCVNTPVHESLAPNPSNTSPPDSDSSPPNSPMSSQSSSSSESIPDSATSASPIPTPPPPPPPLPSHPMQTRAKSGIFKPKHKVNLAYSTPLHHALLSSNDPKTHTSALKREEWKKAMITELLALHKNNTWSLVPRPPNRNIVGSKWLFRTKYRSDGSIERRKARLVAQGYSQVPGLDFTQTFSPVVKAATIRIVLTLAVINNWRLHQLDVNNAFLHGHLDETIYMEQPPGFTNEKYPTHVCKLNKALYGLKQAPRAWFHRLSVFLKSYGFTCSQADPSLFIFNRDSCLMYLLVYVDDLILTGNDNQSMGSFISTLHNEFAIKDLGDVNYFLGLEASHYNHGLFLSQANYAKEILSRANMLDAKPAHTPLASNTCLTSEGEKFHDPTLYRSIVGALQYLTITRPDLSFAVNQVSQYLQSPTVNHYQEVKRILRYVKGTPHYGLHFTRSAQPSVIGFSDADWARCLETRRSTYGYSIFLGGNLVSWSAKKQPIVARSSCESEYRAMANTAAEIIWVTHLLQELHALPPDRPTLLCDNQSALFLTQNPVAHKRAKHIELDYHFVRELVASGKLVTKFIPTKLQVADIFTKSLPRPQFKNFRRSLRLGPPPSRLRGDININ
ncbi:hypothetical protein SSX86_031595 [Deinandra increscens subsp. villosa]|uniref:Integrase catalytic domain-containing protein n=1 Tax=Deinandra increscens subsp. villosa TaxID=3103831 RepID=A0AAP0GI24_9ASTR